MTKQRKPRVRRSVSISVEFYARLRELAELKVLGDNPSQVVANLIREASDQHGVRPITRAEALALWPRRDAPDPEIHSQHFTF